MLKLIYLGRSKLERWRKQSVKYVFPVLPATNVPNAVEKYAKNTILAPKGYARHAKRRSANYAVKTWRLVTVSTVGDSYATSAQ